MLLTDCLTFPKRGLVDRTVAGRSWERSSQRVVSIRTSRTSEETYQSYASRPKRAGASSKHRGVSFRKQTQLWVAQVYWRGRRYFLGSFNTEREAALAYNIHAQRIIGELAVLNDLSPDDGARQEQRNQDLDDA
ncbi:AP2 domain-containing protein [Synechococcus sp. 8F6]|uniref:AP2 domain-containing protein n=1 Tax=Synechococcus sp. 8F6 TaxID=2025606 RepID=UPI000B98508C